MDAVVARAIEFGARMNGHPEHAPDCVAELSEMLTHATDPSTTAHIIRNLGHGWTDPACRAVLSRSEHSAVEVRLAVAQALHCPADPALKSQVADALVKLCADVSDDVREWATFTLGSNVELDSSDVRSALADRLDDPVEAVREEAVDGLERRHDSRAVEAEQTGLSTTRTAVANSKEANQVTDARLLRLLADLLASV